METILISVLSSAVASSVVAALVSGWFGLKAKQTEYVNEYYKLVLQKRMAAYEKVEHLITQVKTAVRGSDDPRSYHILFSEDDDHQNVYTLLLSVNSQSLWLTDDLFDLTRELNLMVYLGTKDGESLIEFGRQNYKPIAELRTKIERLHARDMARLHNVPKFLRGRKPSDSYTDMPA
jgi:hypothetical protein